VVKLHPPVEAEQGHGHREDRVPDHLDQPGQTFSSQAPQQRTDALQGPHQEGQGWGAHLLRPEGPPSTSLVLRRRRFIFIR